MNDDEPTLEQLPPLPEGYEHAPPTIQEQLSPFHSSGGHAIPQGGFPEPTIVAKPPGSPHAVPPMQAPQIVGMPEVSESAVTNPYVPPDGPTAPDGVPAMPYMAPPTVVDSVPMPPVQPAPVQPAPPPAVQPGAVQLSAAVQPAVQPVGAQPVVPSLDAPRIQISPSMELDVVRFEDEPPPDLKHAPRIPLARRKHYAPTYQVLPALQKDEPGKDRSEIWIILGLALLGLVIVVLLGAVIFGVVQRVNAPEPAEIGSE